MNRKIEVIENKEVGRKKMSLSYAERDCLNLLSKLKKTNNSEPSSVTCLVLLTFPRD